MKDNKFTKVYTIIITIAVVLFVGNIIYQEYKFPNTGFAAYRIRWWCTGHNTYHWSQNEVFPLKEKYNCSKCNKYFEESDYHEINHHQSLNK